MVELFLRSLSILVEGDCPGLSVNFLELCVEDYIDSHFLALVSEHLVGLWLILAESIVGIDNGEGRVRGDDSKLLVVRPEVSSGKEVVSVDFSLERERRNVEVGISVSKVV